MTPSSIELSPAERLAGIVPDAEIAAIGPIIEEIDENSPKQLSGSPRVC